MFNKKVFEVYLKQEDYDCTVHTEINAEIEADGLITEAELEQIKDLTLNICKRINIKNGDDELKLPGVFK